MPASTSTSPTRQSVPCRLCLDRHTETRVTVGRYAILRCTSCGLGFLDPQPGPEELLRLYGEEYFAGNRVGTPGYDRYLVELENHRLTFADRLRLLPRPSTGDRLLDVGASIGVFVEQARQAGWLAEGIEPSEWAAGYARDVLHQPVQAGTIESRQFPSEAFSIVTMWEVIEHLPDPGAVLAEIHRLLRPGGILALSTPDAGSTVTRLMGRRWPGWRKIPEHLFYFDRSTLSRLLRGAGFEPMDWKHVSLTVSRQYLWDRVAQVVPLPPRGWMPEGWMARPIRVNPGYDLMVTARRVGRG